MLVKYTASQTSEDLPRARQQTLQLLDAKPETRHDAARLQQTTQFPTTRKRKEIQLLRKAVQSGTLLRRM